MVLPLMGALRLCQACWPLLFLLLVLAAGVTGSPAYSATLAAALLQVRGARAFAEDKWSTVCIGGSGPGGEGGIEFDRWGTKPALPAPLARHILPGLFGRILHDCFHLDTRFPLRLPGCPTPAA